jgi:GT2 family glycosyltransferase
MKALKQVESTVMQQPSSSSKPRLSVIIVSYNTRAMTLDCLRVLDEELRASRLHDSSEIWVVDNASSDGSADAVREQFPAVRVIDNPTNAGFGAANNLALKQAAGEYFLLLNSDAFPKPGAIGTLVKYADAHPDVAVVGPKLLNADGSLQVSCWKFPSPTRVWLENLGLAALLPRHAFVGDYFRWPHDTERTVDFVVGACMLVRRSTYEKVGGFDENFWMYAEETDWQRRMTDAGGRIVFIPAAKVTHLGGASGAGSTRVNQAFWDSLDLYGRKHHGLGGLFSQRVARFIGSLVRALMFTVLSASVPNRKSRTWPKARLHWWLAARQITRRHPSKSATGGNS